MVFTVSEVSSGKYKPHYPTPSSKLRDIQAEGEHYGKSGPTFQPTTSFLNRSLGKAVPRWFETIRDFEVQIQTVTCSLKQINLSGPQYPHL